ncbi:MAG: hypothetical protein AB2556_17135, partial [Candidatus Thiodiazotropha sp.]
MAKQALSVARDAYDLFDEERLKENEALTKAAFIVAHQAKKLAEAGVPGQQGPPWPAGTLEALEADLDAGGSRITNLADPAEPQEATT